MKYSGWIFRFGLVALALALGVAGIFALPVLRHWLKPENVDASTTAGNPTRLVGKDTIAVSADTIISLGIDVRPVLKAAQPRLLSLSGSLALDAVNRLARVNPRFGGEVVALGSVGEGLVFAQATSPDERSYEPTAEARALQVGDHVDKGQLLAVLWSKDLGEKKSELIDGLSRLRLDEETFRDLEKAHAQGAIPEAKLREAGRNVEASKIAVARAERTLRSWRLAPAEIEAVIAEAGKLHQAGNRGAERAELDWARVEVRAPLSGTILEKNVVVGAQVDTSLDLFKIADLSKLAVFAHLYEEDLPLLQALPRPLHWTVRVQGDPKANSLAGTVERIGDIIDPNQHTCLVIGLVDNAEGFLKAGQFITATVQLPAAPDEVVIPATALVEEGEQSIVFVQEDARLAQYTLRKVAVCRRFHDVVYLRTGPDSLAPGARVVISGAVELKSALENLAATNP